jgi:hypothetical protein
MYWINLGGIYQSASEIYGILRGKTTDTKPPVPKRGSSLERPQSAASATPKPLPKNVKSKEAKKQQQKQAESSSINKIYASNVPDFNQSAEDMSKSWIKMNVLLLFVLLEVKWFYE